MKKWIYYFFTELKRNHHFTIYVFIQVVFCTLFLAYVLTNYQNVRVVEELFQFTGLENKHTYWAYFNGDGFEGEDIWNTQHLEELKRLNILSKVGFLDAGFANLENKKIEKCIRVNPEMAKMFRLPVSQGRWLNGSANTDGYEAVAAASLSDKFKIGDVISLSFDDYFQGRQVTSTVRISIVGFLKEPCVGMNFSNNLDGLFTGKFNGLYICLDTSFWEVNRANVNSFFLSEKEFESVAQSDFFTQKGQFDDCSEFLNKYQRIHRQEYAMSLVLLGIMFALSFSGFSGMLLLRHKRKLYEYCIKFISGASWKQIVLYDFAANLIIFFMPTIISFAVAALLQIEPENTLNESPSAITLQNYFISLVFNFILFLLSTLYTMFNASKANVLEISKEGKTWL
jgi:hypothetical protein